MKKIKFVKVGPNLYSCNQCDAEGEYYVAKDTDEEMIRAFKMGFKRGTHENKPSVD